MAHISRFFTGIEIHPAAKIAAGVFIDHGSGVVIGETAKAGAGTAMDHGATLGGAGKDKGKVPPTVGGNWGMFGGGGASCSVPRGGGAG